MTFRDSGCGISIENQKKLFTNFSKVSETQESNKQGVGLGLSICKEIIMANGGSIDMKSEEGKGTDFIISLKSGCRLDERRYNNAMDSDNSNYVSSLNSESELNLEQETTNSSVQRSSLYRLKEE